LSHPSQSISALAKPAIFLARSPVLTTGNNQVPGPTNLKLLTLRRLGVSLRHLPGGRPRNWGRAPGTLATRNLVELR
jgi:hypothetical protein